MPFKKSFVKDQIKKIKSLRFKNKRTNTNDTLVDDSWNQQELDNENAWDNYLESDNEVNWIQDEKSIKVIETISLEEIETISSKEDIEYSNNEEFQNEISLECIYLIIFFIIFIFFNQIISILFIILYYIYNLIPSENLYPLEGNIDPFLLLFSQRYISSIFRNGDKIEDLIFKLINNEISPDDIEKIRVCIVNGKLHTLDNRRLYCFREAINRGANFKFIPIIVIDNNNRSNNIDWKMKGSKCTKVIQHTDWKNIEVRDYVYNGYYE
jgi:hypothetical protein